ncbi:hypothetical protein THC_1411 [Caldimicrobium thiodismutans]|uniref:Uncharacterized protein n=1 Tax=Caldimicrobium thiodismutans TaxID=1653476 RepID=A0A0U5AS65_9BACT|nr:hypothetical protein [Caldimicrobium thiodismutans]BAU23777.1 hypothetical protein THC_1411 [Caldimicrobium thiodismutans]
MAKKKAMTSEKASYVKRKGHADAREFAECLGIGKEYTSEPQAKKDVIDSEGHSYSVKSGEKKWQIFLYSKTRFEKDNIFKGMNGLGELFLECIESFPENRNDYLRDKVLYKKKLQKPMRELCKRLKEKRLLAAFLEKSMLNGGEVDFLVIKEDEFFHVFWGKQVIEVLTENYEVENSKARGKNQMDDQKVIFKVNGKTYGEIEMRNDSDIHYREIKFWIDKKLTFNLLKSNINKIKKLNDRIILYGKAINKLAKIHNRREK